MTIKGERLAIIATLVAIPVIMFLAFGRGETNSNQTTHGLAWTETMLRATAKCHHYRAALLQGNHIESFVTIAENDDHVVAFCVDESGNVKNTIVVKYGMGTR